MKIILILTLLSATAWAQVVNPGGGGSGATLPFPGIVYGTSASAGTVATPAQIAASLPCSLQDAYNICLTQPPYNASGDGATTTTTSGTFGVGTSGTIASCSTFLANQGILITGAGTAGANYIGKVVTCSGTALTVTPATSTSIATGAVVKHDETAAFIAAIAALSSTGGTIRLPRWQSLAASTYRVNGPLLDTGGANAVLPMPTIANYSANPIVISIQGVETPGGTSAQAGEIIQTETPSGNLFGGYAAAAGAGFAPITNVKLYLQDLTLSSYTNPGVVMVNATLLQGLRTSRLYVNMPSPALPSNTAGAAILMPEIANNLDLAISDTNVAGYYIGIQPGEHAQIDRVYSTLGVKCFVFDVGSNAGAPGIYTGNSISGNYLWTMNCTNGIAGGTHDTTINIQNMDFEDNTNDILDSGHLRGILEFHNPNSSSNCTYTLSGTTNLRPTPLWCAKQISTPAISGVNGANMSGFSVLGAGGHQLPANFLSFVGEQSAMTLNAIYPGGSFFTRQNAGGYGAFQLFDCYIGVTACFSLALGPTGAAGSNITGKDSTDIAMWCVTGNQCWINPGVANPTFPSNAVLAANPSANWFIDSSGNETAANVTDSALISGNLVKAAAGGLLADTGIKASVSGVVTSATGGSGTGTITCVTATCTNLRGSYTVAGGTFATGTLLTLVWPTTTAAYVCSGSVLNNATGASIGYHSAATATGMTFSSLTAATGLSIDIDYSCQP